MRSTIRSRHHRPRPLNLVSVLIPTQFCVNLSKSSVCCVSSVMASEVEFWRQDATTKAEGIAREVERLSRQARAAGLLGTAYILGLAVEGGPKEAGAGDGEGQPTSRCGDRA